MKYAALIACFCVFCTLSPGYAAGQKPAQINVGYFPNWPSPGQFSQFKETFDFALGTKVNWIAFADNDRMNAALAAGQLQVAFSQGYVPFIVGVSGGLDLTMVGIAVSYTDSDNCILKTDSDNTQARAAWLEGRKVAVQSGSLTHYKLHKVLTHLGVDPAKVEILATSDDEASAKALQRGEVVMACASGAPLFDMALLGEPLINAAEQQNMGLKSFDIVTVPTLFMNQHAELVQAFMDVLEASNQQWHKNPVAMRAAIARAAGMDLERAKRMLDRLSFPLAEEQKSDAWMGAEILAYTKDIADFLVAEGKLEQSLDSYDRFVTTRFLR